MRKSLFLICVLGLPCVSWAQTNRASWANLSALRAGQKIQIVEMIATCSALEPRVAFLSGLLKLNRETNCLCTVLLEKDEGKSTYFSDYRWIDFD